ncbi:NrtR DNA-binding winged helix domain-containing protein [Mangrovibacterium marinum]|uniref:ADP-ribose pyrophosphatase YjhB (NUDIX family) n=1 Tax=Mangrovibacterium marinum TaxID=1639118 RepID=A0A2T5BXA3_9BACT|nr:NUDIX domain-containing protein [Mangrovibacterium marinum]PTN04795.1 ADP-ribose pyrophosphatase YjhB (NUDIX family) [Mangrovibacterium marinum]
MTLKYATKLENPATDYLAHLSIDCVVFGFHDNQLKVLLLKSKYLDEWSLPGGFVMHSETVEQAARRTLEERTGATDIFMQQFRVFSNPERKNPIFQKENMLKANLKMNNFDWLNQRFVSIGFYALVEFSKVDAAPDIYSEECVWKNVDQVGRLMMDHNQILTDALETLRLQLRHQPIGYNLLPNKFTMPELQKLYETILGRELDRRNFQRKILSYKIVKRLPERRTGVAYKAPYLYRFDLEEYNKALREGLSGDW